MWSVDVASYDAEAWKRKERVKQELRQQAKGQTIVLVNCMVCQTPMKSRGHCPACGVRDKGRLDKAGKPAKPQKDLE